MGAEVVDVFMYRPGSIPVLHPRETSAVTTPIQFLHRRQTLRTQAFVSFPTLRLHKSLRLDHPAGPPVRTSQPSIMSRFPSVSRGSMRIPTVLMQVTDSGNGPRASQFRLPSRGVESSVRP